MRSISWQGLFTPGAPVKCGRYLFNNNTIGIQTARETVVRNALKTNIDTALSDIYVMPDSTKFLFTKSNIPFKPINVRVFLPRNVSVRLSGTSFEKEIIKIEPAIAVNGKKRGFP